MTREEIEKEAYRRIPLTAEILEKNGFVYESDGLTWYDYKIILKQ